jgi:excisionase family DNA binding protein
MDRNGQGTMTRKQVAEYLNLSIPIVIQLERRSDSPLPSLRVGKRVLYPVKLVEEWLEREAHK